MYADDLTLICNSASDLQPMLSEYATTWRYSFNASKSSILVFGESPSSRSCNRPLRSWRLGDHPREGHPTSSRSVALCIILKCHAHVCTMLCWKKCLLYSECCWLKIRMPPSCHLTTPVYFLHSNPALWM